MSTLRWFIEGRPKGEPRMRARAIPDGRGGHIGSVYPDTSADDWKTLVRLQSGRYRPREPWDGPVRVDLVFYLPRPQRLMRKRDPDGPVPATCKPDRDNAEKLLLDVWTRMGFWCDDAQVCDGRVVKLYTAKNGREGVQVTMTQITEVPDVLADEGRDVGAAPLARDLAGDPAGELG